MAKSGLKHIDVGPELTKTEWENEESHELMHGTSFPASPAERQLFYHDDEHKWHIYNGSEWVWLGGGGMEVHGNEYHDPDFATEAALVAHEAVSGAHHSRYTDGEAQAVADAQIAIHAALSTNVHGIQDVPLFSTEAKTYYIDATNGDDGNSGEASDDAFKTWAKAETMIPVFIMHDYEVITLGNLPEGILLEGRTTIAGGSLTIKGNKETAPYYAVNLIDVLSCLGDIRIQYFRTTTDRTFVGYSMLPRLDGVRFIHHDASATSRAFDLEACIMGLRDCDIGTDKAQDGIFATNCRLVSHDNSGNATRYGLYANNSAVIAKRNGQPTGTTANEYTAYGGVIR
jgi:hypothetical protein